MCQKHVLNVLVTFDERSSTAHVVFTEPDSDGGWTVRHDGLWSSSKLVSVLADSSMDWLLEKTVEPSP